jgi:hypothetical protein
MAYKTNVAGYAYQLSKGICMLKSKKIVAAAIFLAIFGSSQVASASNPDVSHAPQVLEIDGGLSDFASTFSGGPKNATFIDNFNFNIASSYDFTATLFAANNLFNITHFYLYNQSDSSKEIAKGSHKGGNNELWSLSVSDLAIGSYFLQVDGKLKSDTSEINPASFTVSVVPEADTYMMLLAGLGLICFLSRRRHVNENFK